MCDFWAHFEPIFQSCDCFGDRPEFRLNLVLCVTSPQPLTLRTRKHRNESEETEQHSGAPCDLNTSHGGTTCSSSELVLFVRQWTPVGGGPHVSGWADTCGCRRKAACLRPFGDVRFSPCGVHCCIKTRRRRPLLIHTHASLRPAQPNLGEAFKCRNRRNKKRIIIVSIVDKGLKP